MPSANSSFVQVPEKTLLLLADDRDHTAHECAVTQLVVETICAELHLHRNSIEIMREKGNFGVDPNPPEITKKLYMKYFAISRAD